MSCCGGKRAQLTRTLAATQPQPQPPAAAPSARPALDPRPRAVVLAYLARRSKRHSRA